MTSRLVAQSELTAADRAAMLQLLSKHFLGVTAEGFAEDLAGKNWAVLLERDGELVGFSTIYFFPADLDGESFNVVCSGDTIVDQAAWGSAAFPKAWIEAVYRLHESRPHGNLVWLLLTSGFRTYRFLPVFWQNFFPRFDRPTPPQWQRRLDTLASDVYGQRFDRSTGIVRFARPQRLQGTLAEIPKGRADDPHIGFFLRRNPGHAAGDELVSIADLSPESLTPAGRRVVYGPDR